MLHSHTYVLNIKNSFSVDQPMNTHKVNLQECSILVRLTHTHIQVDIAVSIIPTRGV